MYVLSKLFNDRVISSVFLSLSPTRARITASSLKYNWSASVAPKLGLTVQRLNTQTFFLDTT